MWRISRRTGGLTVVSALAVGGAAAWVAWTFSGAGTDPTATLPSGPPLPATGYVDPGVLSPGHSIPVTAELYNPNYFAVNVVAPTSSGVDVVTSGPRDACRSEDVVFTGQRRLSVELDAWAAQRMPVGTLSMRAGAGPGCALAGFEVNLIFATKAHAN
ncbi:MAG TPA: hypothetical protein VJT31_21115 [Rugosimonospora sp.]|nr:hypothetical protein [Rugosimonospora sp.]